MKLYYNIIYLGIHLYNTDKCVSSTRNRERQIRFHDKLRTLNTSVKRNRKIKDFFIVFLAHFTRFGAGNTL